MQQIKGESGLMIFDEPGNELTHRVLSTQFSQLAHRKQSFETSIEPWNEDTLSARTYSRHTERPSVSQMRPRKKSVDERIEEIYRKYGKEGTNIGQYIEGLPTNSRELYRQKLNWLEKGPEFRQIGSGTEFPSALPAPIPEQQPGSPVGKPLPRFYYLQQRVRPSRCEPPRKQLQSRCNQNFQRMLKIRDKLRRKHTQAVSRQKQQYQELSQGPSLCTPRENQHNAKATLERNKLKLKMRGISQTRFNNLEEEPSPMAVVGTCSQAHNYSAHQPLGFSNEKAHRPETWGRRTEGWGRSISTHRQGTG